MYFLNLGVKGDQFQISSITTHSVKSLAFHSLLRWRMIILPILATSLFYIVSYLGGRGWGRSVLLWQSANHRFPDHSRLVVFFSFGEKTDGRRNKTRQKQREDNKWALTWQVTPAGGSKTPYKQHAKFVTNASSCLGNFAVDFFS